MFSLLNPALSQLQSSCSSHPCSSPWARLCTTPGAHQHNAPWAPRCNVYGDSVALLLVLDSLALVRGDGVACLISGGALLLEGGGALPGGTSILAVWHCPCSFMWHNCLSTFSYCLCWMVLVFCSGSMPSSSIMSATHLHQ